LAFDFDEGVKMKKVPAHGQTTKGLDVSHYDETIDFEKVKAAGFEFCFAKCTEYKRDPRYMINKYRAKKAGLLFGAYHFFHPIKDPGVQAMNFLKEASIQPGELLPVLDWETTDHVPSEVDKERAKIWLNMVEHSVGKAPIIYGAPYFLEALSLDQSFKKYGLWIAHYKTQAPLVPQPWDVWSFWQFSEKGSVPGIPAPDEDLDVFNGPLENLKKMVV
jgi:lysozyme